jgi:hypothetical protein
MSREFAEIGEFSNQQLFYSAPSAAPVQSPSPEFRKPEAPFLKLMRAIDFASC